MVCDTNLLIYAGEPSDVVCAPFVESPDAVIASVTRIELPGFPGSGQLAPERQAKLREIVATTVEAPLDDGIIRRAILLRQQHKMSLGDSIIAATALEFDVTLITRNTGDFKHIAGFQLINPFPE